MLKKPFILSVNAQKFGDRVALRTVDCNYSYSYWDSLSCAVGEVLESKGFQSGDRVLVLMQPSMEKVVLLTAMFRCGFVFASVSPRIPKKQVAEMAKQVQALFCLFDDDSNVPEEIRSVRVDEVFSEARRERCEAVSPVSLSEGQEATLVWTSGSTRKPKAALHRYGNHWYSALGSNENIKLEPTSHWLLSLPMFHVAGIAIVMRALVAGASIDIPGFDETLEQSLLRCRPTHLSLVATQFMRLLKKAETREVLQQTQAILLGGSAIPSGVLEEAVTHDLPVFVSYGSTEMSSQITTTRPGDGLKEWCGSAGFLLAHRELRLSDDSEIQVRGKTLFAGYLTTNGLVRPFDDDGWFAMGDLGEWQDDDSLRIVGRKDAMFISGGENIQPEEIEWALEQHKDIEQAIVVDVPDSEFGARPHAFLRSRNNCPIHEDELRAHLKRYVSTFKIPDQFHPWPLSASCTGIKVSRSQLRQSLSKA